MLKKRLTILAIAFAVLLIALARLPVAIAALFLPQPLALQGATGTLWSGEAAALGLGGMVVQQRLHWQFQPAALLKGSLAWQIEGEFRDDKSRFELRLRAAGPELRNAMLTLPLEPLVGLSPKLKGLKLGGLIRLNADTLSSKQNNRLDGRLENLSSGLTPTANPFGNYRFSLDLPSSGNGNWQISSLGGLLKANGQGSLSLGTLGGAIQLEVDEAEQQPLKPVLSMLPKGDKGYTLDFANFTQH